MRTYLEFSQEQETLAAIDLGSNALRATIVRKMKDGIEVIKNLREPLRLGEDVFATGRISQKKMEQVEDAFIKLFHTFTEFNVVNAQARATSAMRESANGKELADRIEKSTGIKIQTIHGDEEARLIFEAVRGQIPLKKKTAILMDIGGGSTEITIVKNMQILGAKSFEVGTVRLIQYKDQAELENKVKIHVGRMLDFIKAHLGKTKIDLFIGTGGNLRRIGKIRKKMLGKATSQLAMFDEITHMEQTILSMSYVDRIRRLELDQNRADVILPAIMLTQLLMRELKVEKIHLPKVGLKEGIILSMLPERPKKFILKD